MRISDWSSDVCSSDLISPVEFIPVAEESGLINPLGRWAMYEAAQTLAKWDRQYGKVMPIGVSVNLSPIQMARDDVPSVVEERSEEHTSELQSLMRISYAVFCLKKKKKDTIQQAAPR